MAIKQMNYGDDDEGTTHYGAVEHVERCAI